MNRPKRRRAITMYSNEPHPETDVYLLPYWFAGRVRDDTHHEALLIQGNEDEVIRSMLAAEVVDHSIPVTPREWEAMLHGEDLLPKEEAFMASGIIVSRREVDAWVRQKWHFNAAPRTADDFEKIIVACAKAEPATYCLASAERLSTSGIRSRTYVAVLREPADDRQEAVWHRVDSTMNDLRHQRRLSADSLPIFESVQVGWDWPVYYRDLVANSQLIWSASGEDIDLAALAAEQPHDE